VGPSKETSNTAAKMTAYKQDMSGYLVTFTVADDTSCTWDITGVLYGNNPIPLGKGKAKSYKHAQVNAGKKAKILRADANDRVRRFNLSPDAFADHPLMVAARKAMDDQLVALGNPDWGSLTWQIALDAYHMTTGIYYWRGDTQFVPGMTANHYD